MGLRQRAGIYLQAGFGANELCEAEIANERQVQRGAFNIGHDL